MRKKHLQMRKKHLHEKRGCTFRELGALLGTRALLAGGHEPFTKTPHTVKEGCHEFNMAVGLVEAGCGTVSCIGGTMVLILGRGDLDWHGPTFNNLFYPQGFDVGWDWITPQVAVKAIDNWLATGHPHYDRLYAATRAGKTKIGRRRAKLAKLEAAKTQRTLLQRVQEARARAA